jgi:hypothetical protein
MLLDRFQKRNFVTTVTNLRAVYEADNVVGDLASC